MSKRIIEIVIIPKDEVYALASVDSNNIFKLIGDVTTNPAVEPFDDAINLVTTPTPVQTQVSVELLAKYASAFLNADDPLVVFNQNARNTVLVELVNCLTCKYFKAIAKDSMPK